MSLLLPALPALLVCLIWIVFAAFLMGWGSAHTEARYRQTAARAIQARDYETARVAYWRLVQLKSEKRNEYLFNLAMCMLGAGREREAQGVLTMLAPLDTPGYADAHLFIAKSVLASTNVTPESLRFAEAHLVRATTDKPDLAEAHSILGQLYMRMGMWDAAQKHLREVVATRGEVNLLLAYVLRAKGEETEARSYAERAARYFADKVDKSQGDDPGSRIAWANALTMLRDFETALAVLQSGYKLSSNPVYRPAIGALYAAWLQALDKDSPQDLDNRFRMVQTGLDYAPKNEFLLRELVELTRANGPQSALANASIKKLLTEGGSAAAILHFFLGLDAWQQGKADEAQHHFDIAFEMSSSIPTVANNMAMILTVGPKPDYNRALQLIDPVVKQYPDQMSFRATRGQVLLKLGRYQDAVSDLQSALPGLPDKRMTRLALADAYRHLNMNDLADEQQRLAEALGARPAGTAVEPPASGAQTTAEPKPGS